jgi:hypothetical protein
MAQHTTHGGEKILFGDDQTEIKYKTNVNLKCKVNQICFQKIKETKGKRKYII